MKMSGSSIATIRMFVCHQFPPNTQSGRDAIGNCSRPTQKTQMLTVISSLPRWRMPKTSGIVAKTIEYTSWRPTEMHAKEATRPPLRTAGRVLFSATRTATPQKNPSPVVAA